MGVHDTLRKLDDDRVVAGVLFAIAFAALTASFSYSYDAAVWPRFAAICILIGTGLVLVQHVLPEPIRAIVADDYRAINQDDELRDQAREEQAERGVEFDPTKAVRTTLLLIGFAVLVLFIGYVVSTVFFVLIYAHYSDMKMRYAVLILAVCLLTFYVVAPGLSIPLFEGLADFAPVVEIPMQSPGAA